MSRSRAVALIFALALAAGSIAVLAPADARTSITTLTVVDGLVLIRHGDVDFARAHVGEVVAAGATIRTAAGASAEVTYFEGSSVRLASDAQIVVEALRARADGGPLTPIAQTIARTWHVVAELLGGSTRYEMRTPTSTASVRG
jgi:hypothetical protein